RDSAITTRSSTGHQRESAEPWWRHSCLAPSSCRPVVPRTSGQICTASGCRWLATGIWPTIRTAWNTRWTPVRRPKAASWPSTAAPVIRLPCWPSTNPARSPPSVASLSLPFPSAPLEPSMTIVEQVPQPDPSILERAGDSISDSLIRTLPGNAYFSPEIFAREQEKIFEQMWICVARGRGVAKPGDFKTVQVARESLIISRNRRREPRAFFNVCRHRGARVCSEESGTGKRSFQCPYHAWTYDLDGKLIA